MSEPRPIRTFRVDNALWFRALAIARSRGESLSEIIRAALADYVGDTPK